MATYMKIRYRQGLLCKNMASMPLMGSPKWASIGGLCFQEYQIRCNPDALKAYNIPLHKVMAGRTEIKFKDVGGKDNLEINQAANIGQGTGS